MLQFWFFSGIYLLWFHPLSKYPGPKLWAVSRLPWALHVIKGDLWLVLDEFHLKYGRDVRIAPDEVSSINPVAWRDLYSSKPVLPKDPYSLTPPLGGSHSLFTAEGDTHRRIRAALVNGFSDKAQRDQAPIVETYGDQLTARLRREAANIKDGSVNIQKLYGYATFETVTDLSFGEAMLNTLEGDTENDEITTFFLHAKFGTIRNCLSRFWPLDAILGLIMLRVTRPKRERNWKLVTSKIDRRLARGDLTGVRSDFLSPVVSKIGELGQKGSITKQELIANQLAFVIADCQLSTVALSTNIFLLLRDPVKWKRLVDEIRSHFKSSHEITVQSTQQAPYLEAVINESMRVHHPTPISLPRSIPAEGRVVGDQVIPGNVRPQQLSLPYNFCEITQADFRQTIFGVNLHNIQTSPELWTKPHEFHPERFLAASDPRYNHIFDQDVKAAFMPFSTGARNCLGSK